MQVRKAALIGGGLSQARRLARLDGRKAAWGGRPPTPSGPLAMSTTTTPSHAPRVAYQQLAPQAFQGLYKLSMTVHQSALGHRLLGLVDHAEAPAVVAGRDLQRADADALIALHRLLEHRPHDARLVHADLLGAIVAAADEIADALDKVEQTARRGTSAASIPS